MTTLSIENLDYKRAEVFSNEKQISSFFTPNRANHKLSLDIPEQDFFYFVKDEDLDEGILYTKAKNFYKKHTKIKRLGQGSTSVVKLYKNKVTDQTVAVKVTRAVDEETKERIKAEFRVIRELKHSSILSQNKMYLDHSLKKIIVTMDYFPSQDLKNYISKNGPLNGKN